MVARDDLIKAGRHSLPLTSRGVPLAAAIAASTVASVGVQVLRAEVGIYISEKGVKHCKRILGPNI